MCVHAYFYICFSYQKVLLECMHMPEQTIIAKNAALKENVFMMFVCIELRIPLFLIGKPGSSKSLAKSIVQDSMRGETSSSRILSSFKKVLFCFTVCHS